MPLLLFVLLLAPFCNCSSLPKILGMQDLLKGLAIPSPSTDQFGQPSTAYMLDPNLNLFILQFRTRT